MQYGIGYLGWYPHGPNKVQAESSSVPWSPEDEQAQRMGDMPDELRWPDPAIKKIGLDLAGPIMMKADVRRRSGKHDDGRDQIWIVIIVCSSTSAV